MAITAALTFIKDYIAENQGSSAGWTPELKHVPKNIDDTGTGPGATTFNEVRISLINIEEERSLKQPYKKEKVYTTYPARVITMNPDLHLNLYVLFTGVHSTYETALKGISFIIQTFSTRNYFPHEFIEEFYASSSGTTNDGIDRLESLTLDMYSQTLDQNSALWQALGGNLLPAVLYKVRLVTYTPEPGDPTGTEVIGININSTLK